LGLRLAVLAALSCWTKVQYSLLLWGGIPQVPTSECASRASGVRSRRGTLAPLPSVNMARPTDRNSFKHEAERTFPYRFDIRVPESGGAVHRAPLKTGNLLGSGD
jgi:hypothetical protein